MKQLYLILSLFISIVFTSCEEAGIEVTTIKGTWICELSTDYKIKLIISDDKYGSCIIRNDTIISAKTGTWTLKDDTLNVYIPCYYDESGIKDYKLEHISMSTLTLRNLSYESIWVFNRVYSTSSDNYGNRFLEVLDLKKGFWWFFWNGLLLIGGLLGAWTFFYIFCSFLQAIYKLARYIFQKIRK